MLGAGQQAQRTRGGRRDALSTSCFGGIEIQVTTSLETLLGLSGAPAAETDFSLPISSKAVERLACDCTVTRVLLGSDSTVIDVGRARRVISGAQGKALRIRDRGCVWPGCDRPATWTSGHQSNAQCAWTSRAACGVRGPGVPASHAAGALEARHPVLANKSP